MRIAIVGAGAVSHTFGVAAVRGGASVTYFVRNIATAPRTISTRGRFEVDDVPCDVRPLDELTAASGDLILLGVPAPALDDPGLKGALARSAPTPVVCFAPDFDALERTRKEYGTRASFSLIGFVAWEREGMVDLWTPPLSKTLFDRAVPPGLVAALRAGGLPVKIDAGAARVAVLTSAAFLPWVLALDLADWDIERLRRSPDAKRVRAASSEALAIAERAVGSMLGVGMASSRLGFLTGYTMATRVASFDFAEYFRSHFGKLRGQTNAVLTSLVERGKRDRLRTDALTALLARAG